MKHFPCPHLNCSVELTDERADHIAASHPELLPDRIDRMALTLADPDEVRIDADYARTRLFIRWFNDLLGGKMVITVVVSDQEPTPPESTRHWIVTAFIARKPTHGDLEWKRL